MKRFAPVSFLILGIACWSAGAARAEQEISQDAVQTGQHVFFNAALGYTSAGTFKHPDISGKAYAGEMLELAAGLEIGTRLRVSGAFTVFQTTISRAISGGSFTAAQRSASGYYTYAGCERCPSIDRGGGGTLVSLPIHISTLGPRVDYLPWGASGPYVGVTAGAALIQDLKARAGLAGAARIGFEWRPFPVMALSIEAGAHAQTYSDASAFLPYAALGLSILPFFSSPAL
jgi:hypothetical protein